MSQQNIIRESFISWHQEKYPGRPVVLDPVWAEYCESVVASAIPELRVFSPARPMDEVKLLRRGAAAERDTAAALRRDRNRLLAASLGVLEALEAHGDNALEALDDAAKVLRILTLESRP